MLPYSILKRISPKTRYLVRYKHSPEHWKWDSIRKGLLGKRKYVAVINNYGDSEETMSNLEHMGAINMRTLFNLEKGYIQEELEKNKRKEDFIPESSHYRLYDNESQSGFKVEKEYDLHFPENLNIYCYEGDSESDFDSPKRGSTGVFNYYLMDGGSTLPVLALGLKPGHKVLDMCASPGGKSLLAIQTLYPDCVVSNDVSNSRLNRIQNVFDQFLYDFDEKWLKKERVKLTNIDGRCIMEDNFDRILVDVPCTTDRHSLHENDNNIFKPSRIKERLQLPELQRELLFHALKLVKKGGVVVYSTCSLSPIQNDGVVHMALRQIWEETNIEIVIKDLTPALIQSRSVFELADKKLLKFGHLVLPCLSQNYGPTYFCKLQKIN
ncbi:hypothetical protein NQ314_019940 [Rhamnusium bicolor]|uniref:NOL1/NOP2/Sun domain family member 4 n=1 Tax=Rhamnusium bicolor TaxID=1586634 RepID=A0AAV8WN21_9CUCU|nr:hypothetical protein NQ314_019940 [Rhamnusium bicolor]